MLGRQRSRWETRAAGLTSSGSRHGCTGWCRTGAPSHEPARGPAAQQDLVPTASIPTSTAAADDSNRVILLIILWTDVAIIGQPSSARQPVACGVGDRHRELVLAHIDRDRDRRRRHWGSLNRHETHLRGCRKARRSNADRRVEKPRGPFLASPEVWVREPLAYISGSCCSGPRRDQVAPVPREACTLRYWATASRMTALVVRCCCSATFCSCRSISAARRT